MVSHSDNALYKQVLSLPQLLEQQYKDLEPKTRELLSIPETFALQRIVLVGCGDSYAAALTTKHAFELFTHIPTEVVTALEFSRLYQDRQLGFSPGNPLVILISSSGTGARVYEAACRANLHNAFTLAITGNPQSPLGKEAHRILHLEVPPFSSAAGTRSYLVSQLSLLLLAIRFGEVRGVITMDEANRVRKDILLHGSQLEAMLPAMEQQALALAKEWQSMEAFDFVGGGFDYGTAWFGHAKVLEALGKPAMRINSEEWLHLNCFLRNNTATGTVLIANTTNPCHSRSRETAGYMAQLGRPLLIVTDGEKDDFGVEATYIRVPGEGHPICMPLTQFVPLCLLAGFLQDIAGEKTIRGAEGPWSFAKGGGAVKGGEIVVR